MEEQIKILEERVNILETLLLKNLWEILLDDIVKDYMREHYPYGNDYTDLYSKVRDSMKEQIKTLLMGGDH